MGLFGLFGSKEEKDTKRLKDLAKKSQEKYGDPSVRSKALEQLRELGTPEAIGLLLQRFTVKVEPGITDAEEKDYIFSIIEEFGDKAVDPVKDFIRKTDSASWGVRCLEALVDEDEVVETLVSVLDRLAKEYSREPDKKVLLINHLANHKDPRIAPAVVPFLDDQYDDVRIAALGTLVKQGDASALPKIVEILAGHEAVRVRAAAAAALADAGFPLGEHKDAVAAALPPELEVDDSGVVKRR